MDKEKLSDLIELAKMVGRLENSVISLEIQLKYARERIQYLERELAMCEKGRKNHGEETNN